MANAIETKAATLTTKRRELEKFFNDHKDPTSGAYTHNADQLVEVKTRNDELNTLETEYRGLLDTQEIERKNLARIGELDTPVPTVPFSAKGGQGRHAGHDGGDATGRIERIDIGQRFIDSKGYKDRRAGTGPKHFAADVPGIETKTLFTTTNGWDPFVTRLGRVALSPQQMPKIIDAFPTGTTNQHSIKFMLETLYTNAAAETAEGGLYPESALKLTEQLQAVCKVAVILPVTDEQLDDEEQSRDYINARLDLQMRQRLDSQLINGNNVAPNLQGLANLSNAQTRALTGTDAVPDLILKSIVDVQTVAFCEPSSVLMSPHDWMNIRLLRTADGLYIWGHPSLNGPATIWGLPVITSTYIAQGAGYVGDFAGQFMLFWRRGIEFLVSNSHLDYFARGQLAIRAEMRLALVCFRQSAVVVMSGMPS